MAKVYQLGGNIAESHRGLVVRTVKEEGPEPLRDRLIGIVYLQPTLARKAGIDPRFSYRVPASVLKPYQGGYDGLGRPQAPPDDPSVVYAG
jgi:hypothetical protein